jgi:hypothetical protein
VPSAAPAPAPAPSLRSCGAWRVYPWRRGRRPVHGATRHGRAVPAIAGRRVRDTVAAVLLAAVALVAMMTAQPAAATLSDHCPDHCPSEAARAVATAGLPSAAAGLVRQGTCGWSDESLTKCGRFYPPSLPSTHKLGTDAHARMHAACCMPAMYVNRERKRDDTAYVLGLYTHLSVCLYMCALACMYVCRYVRMCTHTSIPNNMHACMRC